MTDDRIVFLKPRSIGASRLAFEKKPNHIKEMFGTFNYSFTDAYLFEPEWSPANALERYMGFNRYKLSSGIFCGRLKLYKTKRQYRRLMRESAARNNKRVGPGAAWSKVADGPGRGVAWGEQ